MRIFLIREMILIAGIFTAARVAMADQTIKAESMHLTGCAGTIPGSTPFAGARFYCNGDSGTSNITLPTVPGRYRIIIRGASTNISGAGISIFLNGAKVGSCTFAGTSASACTVMVDIATHAASTQIKLVEETDNGTNDTDIDNLVIAYAGPIPPPPAPPVVPSVGAFASRKYRNLFAETGHDSAAIVAKVNASWQQLFYGDDANQRVYYPVGTDMAYIKDVGDNDVRSEGMSYGMMICVQLDKKAEFDRLWKWAKMYMYHATGDWQGYFAWQMSTAGAVLDAGAAPDGEEYFTTALLFAAHRWGNGTGIYNYASEAQALLNEMLHHEEHVNQYSGIKNMFSAAEKKVVFSPNNSSALFTDPSYHLPAFYKLWAKWSANDGPFWDAAADSSRAYFKRTTNSSTGLGPDYSEFSGAPNNTGNHGDFRFDAWRIAQNIAIDYAWWAADPWQKEFADRIQQFFESKGISSYANQFSLSGSGLSTDHSPGLVAMNAVASLAATNARAWKFVDELWNSPIPSGQWRYYDGMLYMLGLLHVSGNFKIYDLPSATIQNDGSIHPAQAKRLASNRSRTYDPAGRLLNAKPAGSRMSHPKVKSTIR